LLLHGDTLLCEALSINVLLFILLFVYFGLLFAYSIISYIV